MSASIGLFTFGECLSIAFYPPHGMDHDTLEVQVTEFLAWELRICPDRLTNNARLLHDLGVDGADGWELLEDFSRQFGIDMTGFQPSLHFGPEAGPNPFLYLYRLIRPSARVRFVPITVADLVVAARTRRWTTPSC